MSERHIPYRVERTSNRHSRAVYKDDTIIIRLAKNLSAKAEKEHVDNLLKRMTEQVLKDIHRESIDPFRALLDGASEHTVTLADGTAYEYELLPGDKTVAKQTKAGWTLHIAEETRQKQLHQLLWKTIAQSEVQNVAERVRNINSGTLNVDIAKIRVGHATSQWGSCSSKGVIMLNTSLLFMPEDLLDYVIVHELCHRKIADHSPRYWDLVEQYYPDYKAARKKLRGFKLLTL